MTMSDDGLLNGSPAQASATANQSAGPVQGRPAGGGGWPASLPEDLRGLAEHQGWKEPADALRGYRHLEKAFGEDKAGRALLAPKDAEDTESYERIYKALGRPDDIDGYELNSVFGEDAVDENFLGAMAKTMHEAGLSKAQAHKMGAAYQEICKSAMEESAARHAAEVKEVKSSLSPETLESARRGFRLFRLPPEEGEEVAGAIEQALGPKAAAELFARLGRAAGEDRPPAGGDSFTGDIFTGDALRRIDQLLDDKAFSERYLSGDTGANQRIEELYRRVAGK